MISSSHALAQSRFFHPAFNTAIYEGPLRIYFAQVHESLALKIYFLAQQKLIQELARAKEQARKTDANIWVMLYPTQDSFLLSFEDEVQSANNYVKDQNYEDVVIGIRRPLEDSELEGFIEYLGSAIQNWNPKSLEREHELIF